jgi:hypothetical protein
VCLLSFDLSIRNIKRRLRILSLQEIFFDLHNSGSVEDQKFEQARTVKQFLAQNIDVPMNFPKRKS